MTGKNLLGCSIAWILFQLFVFGTVGYGQNIQRYKPLDLESTETVIPKVPTDELPEVKGDDRELVYSLDSVVIVDDVTKVSKEEEIDQFVGLRYDFATPDSLVYGPGVRRIVGGYLDQPITLRSINQLARDIIAHYRERKQPIVDVVIPEQRITGGTLYLVVIETRIDKIKIQSGCYFKGNELSRWIDCTVRGDRVYEQKLENDLFWLNQNPFRRVNVDFEKGDRDGTTNVIYKSTDVLPLRGYIGTDDSGVKTLNYGRYFTGFSYGNLFGFGGTLGYQFTTDQYFESLAAHAVSLNQPINREFSINGYGSWASVASSLGGGLNQGGESWQTGGGLVRQLIRDPYQSRNLTLGYDFKSTNNNLEFAGTTVTNSNADLFEFRLSFEDFQRKSVDEYSLCRWDSFVGPGGGLTGSHSTDAFQTIRQGTSPDYFYTRLLVEGVAVGGGFQLLGRFRGQLASERLLFSEMLGLGGFDSIRGFDQRSYNADNGWVLNLEFGPQAKRWGTAEDAHVLRTYSFVDIGNGYIADPQPGEDAYTLPISTGLGLRYQISDRLTCRLDYGYGLTDIANSQRSNRLHFGVTWIPGKRP